MSFNDIRYYADAKSFQFFELIIKKKKEKNKNKTCLKVTSPPKEEFRSPSVIITRNVMYYQIRNPGGQEMPKGTIFSCMCQKEGSDFVKGFLPVCERTLYFVHVTNKYPCLEFYHKSI